MYGVTQVSLYERRHECQTLHAIYRIFYRTPPGLSNLKPLNGIRSLP